MASYTPSRVITFLAIAGLVAFLVGYGSTFLKATSVSPEKAKALMAERRGEFLLIDVRSAEEFADFSLKDAVNIPLKAVSQGELAPWKRLIAEKSLLLLICNTGYQSAQATETLRRAGYAQAFNVEGGMDAWLASGGKDAMVQDTIVRTAQGETSGVPRLIFSWLEQALICFTAFGLKPIYEIISLILVLLLWTSRDADLAALRRAMTAFFIGETACAVNYLFFDDFSLLLEFLHMYGMMICFGLASYAFMKAVDMRVCHFTTAEKKCTLLPLCRSCYKYEPVTCNLWWLFIFVVPATALLAFMPLAGELRGYYYIGKIFGQDVIFAHPLAYQYIEIRFFPLIGLAFFVTSFIILLRRREAGMAAAKVYFAAGLGALGFSLMRFVIFGSYSRNPLWAEAWEEITEFLFIGFVLWIVLRVKPEVLQRVAAFMGSPRPVREKQVP